MVPTIKSCECSAVVRAVEIKFNIKLPVAILKISTGNPSNKKISKSIQTFMNKFENNEKNPIAILVETSFVIFFRRKSNVMIKK